MFGTFFVTEYNDIALHRSVKTIWPVPPCGDDRCDMAGFCGLSYALLRDKRNKNPLRQNLRDDVLYFTGCYVRKTSSLYPASWLLFFAGLFFLTRFYRLIPRPSRFFCVFVRIGYQFGQFVVIQWRCIAAIPIPENAQHVRVRNIKLLSYRCD